MPTMPGIKKGRSKKNLAAEKFTREEEIKDIAENLSTILSLLTTKVGTIVVEYFNRNFNFNQYPATIR